MGQTDLSTTDGPIADLGGAPSADGGKLPFLSQCSSNNQCEGGVCGNFPAKGAMFCSRPCTVATAAADCPAPSPGCNNMGICRVP